ncbi:hypothetical protein A2V56_03665 [Candidatus Woesebacteria bacterium RBG_19FT_COMBO_42_9]|nr:MAG: hypothetical protein A2V56_03665 [Candidatus Woesebacteria bacterium RBG_19FT_COMBO_42_9]
MTDLEPGAGSFEKLGFKRIGNSDLFIQGEFVVENASETSPSIFVDYDSHTDWPGVIGIKLGKGFGGLSLVTLTGDGDAIERTINGSGGGIWRGEVPTEAEFRGRTIESQLADAGFDPDKKDEHLFRKRVDEDEYKGYVVAWVQDGRLQRVLKPVHHRVTELTGEKFEIAGYKDIKGFFGKPASALTLKNDLMQFDISSEIDGRLVDGSQRLLRSATEEELGLNEFEVVTERSGFKIGGVNSTDLIHSLDSLAGQPISKLEERLRPGKDSMMGFLGQNESLISILADDNDFVLSHDLTHQDLALPLFYAREHYLQGKGREFTYKGRKFSIQATAYRGMQFSPFDDRTGTNIDMVIKNEDTGASLSYSGLLPDMIQRYGFYEGKGTSYRLEPSKILEVFDFL